MRRFEHGMGGVVLALALSACPAPKTVRELVVEANVHLANGRVDEARAVLDPLLAQEPDNVEVLLSVIDLHVEAGDLDQAGSLIAQLEQRDLTDRDEGRFGDIRRRYFRALLEISHGEHPAEPRDASAYETALIGMVNLDRGGSYQEELLRHWQGTYRRRLGGNADNPIDLSNRGPVAGASLEDAQAALATARKIRGDEPRLRVRLRLDEPIVNETDAVIEALRVVIFRHEFDQRWSGGQRAAFIAAGRFDANIESFTLTIIGPAPADFPPDTDAAAQSAYLQAAPAVEAATDLVYELAGVSRQGDPAFSNASGMLGATLVDGIARAPDGTLSWRLTLPRDGVRNLAFLLQRRLDERAPAEGSGGQPPGSGSGASPAPDSE